MATFTAALGSLAQAQKSKQGVSLYTRWINRPIGRVFAAGAHVLGLTPNMITALSAIATGSALVLLVLVRPTLWLGLLIALLLVVGFALDSADGQLARLSGRSSAAGEWLDHVVDSGKMVLLHGAVLVAGWRFWEGPVILLALPLIYQATAVIMFSGLTLVDLLLRISGQPTPVRSPSTLRAVLLLPADYGVLALSFLLWGLTPVFQFWYGLLVAANVIICALMLVRWFRRLAPAAA